MIIQKKSGFVLLFVLMMMSVITLVTQQLLRGVMVGTMFDKTMIARERAEILALGGIQVAIALLTQEKEPTKQGTDKVSDEKENNDPEKATKKWLARILPILNRWKIFELKEKTDGLDGTLKICISCEEGKLNLNEMFDFKAQAFKPEYEQLLQNVMIDGKHPVIKFLTEFLKKRNKKLDDLSQLMVIPEFGNLDVFYEPPKVKTKKEKQAEDPVHKKERNVALFDLFTLDSEKGLLQPLLLSDGMCAVFGLRRPEAEDTENMKDKFKAVAESYKKEWSANWGNNFAFINPIYEHSNALFPQSTKLFFQEFEPSVYSVVSLAIVDGVEQRLLALIKKVEKKKDAVEQDQKDASKPSDDEKNKAPATEFKIIKMYWI